jgi:excisionase family DNA binding protein
MSRPRTPAPASERFLTIDDVAERCQVSPRSVRRWIDDQHLQTIRFGRSIRVSEGDLAAFITRCKKSK